MADKTDERDVSSAKSNDAPNPVWFKPVMIGLMLLGLVWILVYYISGAVLPIPDLDGWNLVIGFVIAFAGFLMTMRWR